MKRNPADVAFSLYIRTRAGSVCEYCGNIWRQLHAYHFHGRKKASTRLDEENVACLCSTCHSDFHTHPNIHTDWMKKRLGSAKYELLNIRAEQYMKMGKLDIKERAEYYKKRLEEYGAVG